MKDGFFMVNNVSCNTKVSQPEELTTKYNQLIKSKVKFYKTMLTFGVQDSFAIYRGQSPNLFLCSRYLFS